MMSAVTEPSEFTTEAVERALQQLYYDPDMARKNVAQEWLARARASPQAWQFCWALLSSEQVPEIQFFGASTLHEKISGNWQELDGEHRDALRSRLFSHVCRFALGPKMVLSRLCSALASLVLRTLLDSWRGAVPDLLQVLQWGRGTEETDARHPVLLEVLSALPEELQSRKLTSENRDRLQETLVPEWKSLCPVLRELLRRDGLQVHVKERAVRCAASWLELGVDLGDAVELLQDSLELLGVPELFEAVVESGVGALSMPDWQRYPESLLKLMPSVLGLQEQLRRAVQDRDMETAHGICRIAIALCETHCRTLLDQTGHWQAFQALVNMILSCTAISGHYPVDEIISPLTLTFWYTLQDDITSLETDKRTFYLQLYRPVYFQLVDVLLHKARFSNQHDSSWSADDKEQFRTYRVDISDTLMCAYELLGPELLRKLYDKLGLLLTDTTHSSSCQDIEALLYGFQSISDTADVRHSDVIPGLIGVMPLIRTNDVHLAETVLLTIGSLAEWLSDHAVMLPSILRIVLPALCNADLSVPAASTLKRICRECRERLQPHASDILSSSQDALVKKIHERPQSMWLMQALGFLLSSLSDDEVPEKLHSLLSPHIRELQSLANQPPSAATKHSVVDILNLLSSLFSTLDLNTREEDLDAARSPRFPPHTDPVVVVLKEVLPLIQTLLTKWLKETEVVEAACAVFEKALKTLYRDFAPLVSQLCELIGQLFSAYPQASALDLTREVPDLFPLAGEANLVCTGAQLFQIFAAEKEHVPAITSLLELITNITIAIFHHGARDHPDVVESFMRLHTQVLKSRAGLYLSVGLDIRVVFYCGILAFKFPEAPTLRSTCLFFIELLSHRDDVPAITEVLQEDSLLLLHTLLEAISIQTSQILLGHLADVVFSISLHCPGLLAARLPDALQSVSFPCSLVRPEDKENFCRQILGEQANKRTTRSVVKEFSLLCRGPRGTEGTDY